MKPVSFDVDFKENASPSKNSQKMMEKFEERKKKLEGSAEKMYISKIQEKLEKAEMKRKSMLQDKSRILQEVEIKKLNQKQQNEAIFQNKT